MSFRAFCRRMKCTKQEREVLAFYLAFRRAWRTFLVLR